jgi:hypothetical protein
MRFPHLWRRGSRADGRQPVCTAPPAGEGYEVGDEVAAFLAGRLVDHYAAVARAIPPWAVLNRLAHAERPELARLLTGRAPVAWAGPERQIAAHLLTRALTPEALRALQRDVLVPLELALIERSKPERIGVDEVLAAAVDALGTSPAA